MRNCFLYEAYLESKYLPLPALRYCGRYFFCLSVQTRLHCGCSVIQFLKARNVRVSKIHHQIKEIYGERVMTNETVQK